MLLISQFRQVKGYVYDQLLQTLEAVQQQSVQRAGLAYFKLIQVHPQLGCMERQVLYQLLQITSHAIPQSVDGVQRVGRQLFQAKGRGPS